MIDNLSDVDLIQRCLDNADKTAWEIFVRRFSRLIWNTIHKTFHTYCFRYTDEDSEDMYSAMFLSLVENDFRKLRQFKSENACSLGTWLTIITSRMTIDFMRKEKGRYVTSSGGDGRDIFETIPEAGSLVDLVIEERQTEKLLNSAISMLSPRDRMLYDLLYRQGFSPDEAAKSMGMTVGAVYTSRHRIIAKIKKDVKDV